MKSMASSINRSNLNLKKKKLNIKVPDNFSIIEQSVDMEEALSRDEEDQSLNDRRYTPVKGFPDLGKTVNAKDLRKPKMTLKKVESSKNLAYT